MARHGDAAQIEIRLLGPLEVAEADGTPISIVSAPQRRLLSLLALRAGSVVRPVSLAESLGLEAGALRTAISRLRRVVGAGALETTAEGYKLLAEVDGRAFERLVALASTIDDGPARSALAEAVLLWRGDPLAEFADEQWAEPAIGRLHEQYANAVEDLAVLQLDAGEVGAALMAIMHVIEQQPYRDRARALLMRALAEGGRRTEALRAFQTYRTTLLDEIGTEPSALVVDVDRAVATSDERSTRLAPQPGHPAWTRTRRLAPSHRSAPPVGLPVPVSSFVGRQQDLITVQHLLASHRLVTLTGAGGCGKTRLAIAAAAAEVDHARTVAYWVELGVVADPSHVVEHVAAAVGLTPQPGLDPARQLVGHLRSEQPTLLVLDNAEHLLAPVTEMLARVLPRCPSLRVLVTSRVALGLAGEEVWRVPSLETPPDRTLLESGRVADYDAVQLFLERARSGRPGLVLDADALGHVAAICIGVDGLPLALELAAARTRNQPLEVVARGINDAVRWQAAAGQAPLARHATLHASIAWSVDHIDPLAQSMLTRLAVFQSSFTIDAAVYVGADDGPRDEIAGGIGALADASLLQFDGGTGRYRMLRTIRQFCAVRAQQDDGLDQARERHAQYYAAFCSGVGAGLGGIERGPIIREMPDLVAAMEWARAHDPRLVFQMCAGLASVRSALGHHGNVADTWQWLLSLDRDVSTDEGWSGEWATAVAALMAAATAHWLEIDGLVDELDRMLPADDHRARSWLSRGAAMVPAYQGRLGPILAHVEDVQARRDDLELSIYGGFAAYMLALTGRIDESASQVGALARLCRRHRTSFRVDTIGNGYAAAIICDHVRGDLRAAAGRGSPERPSDPAFSMTAAAALAHVALLTGDQRTLDHAVAWSDQQTIPLLRYLPTFIELVRRRLGGELDHAADLAEQFWDEAAPVPVSRVHPLPLLTAVLIEAGRPDSAAAMTEIAVGLVAAMDNAPLLEAGIVASRAQIAIHTGSVPRALPPLRELLALTTTHGFVPMTIEALEQVAVIADDASLSAALRTSARNERHRIGFRHLHPDDDGAPNGGPPLPLAHAVVLAQRWLEVAAPSAEPVADARL